MNIWDVIIVGGGASGLASAIMLKRINESLKVLVLEKQSRVGKKLLATGNGTCNLSNKNVSPKYYHSNNKFFPDFVLMSFPYSQAISFFESMGVQCISRENGRIYPLCENAGAVLDCIRNEAMERGVQIQIDTCVNSIQQKKDVFVIGTNQETYQSKYVIISAGGNASPKLGGCRDGYTLLKSLGHSMIDTFPSIVQIKTDVDYVKAVKGLRVDANVSIDNCCCSGEVLFTEYGLSGPAIMQISRIVGENELTKNKQLIACLDLLPDFTLENLEDELNLRTKRFPNRLLEDYLTGLVKKRIGQTILRSIGIGPFNRSCNSLTSKEIQQIAKCLKNWEFKVLGTKGINDAQVTAGGIDTKDFNPVSLESNLKHGLYAIGEVLDVDGDCGGYNLHWAWASACAAATAIGKEL